MHAFADSFVEPNSVLWDRLLFRDYLIEFPEEARKYEKLKTSLSREYPNDRVAYTIGKTDFVQAFTRKAKQYYHSQ